MTTTRLQEHVLALWEGVVAFLPSLAGALLLALVGWLTAQLSSRLMLRLMTWGYATLNAVPALSLPATNTGPMLFARIVFWAVLLAFLGAASAVLGLELFQQWLNALLDEVPGLVAAAMVVFAGFICGQLARELVVSGASSAGFQYPSMLGLLVQVVVLTVSAVIGLELLGLNSTILVVFAAILLGTAGLALALAFAGGAKAQVSNLLGGRDLRRFYKPGDRIRIAELEGTILHLSARSVLLDAQEGRILIPAQLFAEQPSVLIAGAQDEQ